MAQSNASVFSSSWAIFIDLLLNRWQSYLWYVVLNFILGFSFVAAAVGFFYAPLSKALADPAALMSGAVSWMSFVYPLVFFLVFALFLLFVGLWVHFGFLRVAADPKSDQTVSEIFSRGADRYGMTLLSMIAWGLMFAVFLVLGFVLLVVPAVYLLIALMFGSYLVIIDNQGPWEAIKKSRALVKGQWWGVAITFLFWMIFGMVVMFVVNMFFEFVIFAVVDISTISNLQTVLASNMQQQNFQAAFESISQMFNEVMTPSLLLAFSLQIFLKSVLEIVTVFGLLSLYKVVVGKK